MLKHIKVISNLLVKYFIFITYTENYLINKVNYNKIELPLFILS